MWMKGIKNQVSGSYDPTGSFMRGFTVCWTMGFSQREEWKSSWTFSRLSHFCEMSGVLEQPIM